MSYTDMNTQLSNVAKSWGADEVSAAHPKVVPIVVALAYLSGCSEMVAAAFVMWVLTGRRAGSFVMAVLGGSLMETFATADDQSMASLQGITQFLYNACPSSCHGNAVAVKSWHEAGGLCGMYAETAKAQTSEGVVT